MSSNILAVHQGVSSFTITVASLATATARQSTMIDNSSNKFRRAIIYLILKTGTAPTAGTTYDVYLLRGDNPASSAYRTDGAGASDAAFTPNNAIPLGSIKLTASANTLFYGEFDTADVTNDLGPEWGIAVLNNATGQSLNASGHVTEYQYIVDQAQ